MAIIYSYPTVTPASGDLIVGTDITGKVTKNFTVGSIVSTEIPTYITGTTNTVPLFTGANNIGNSIITQNTNGDKISVGGNLNLSGPVTSSLSSDGLASINLNVVDSAQGNAPDYFLISLDNTGNGLFYAKTLELGDGESVYGGAVFNIDSPNSKFLFTNGKIDVGTVPTKGSGSTAWEPVWTDNFQVQGTMTSSGNVSIGTPREFQNQEFDLNLLNSNSKIAFGDNHKTGEPLAPYTLPTWNVVVGEYGSSDTDQLQLHGKSGTFFTKGDLGTDVAMVINSSGSVGIGTTIPNAKLNVDGDIKIEGENNLWLGGSTSIPSWQINATGNDLGIHDIGGNSGNLIFSGQKMGIGTSAPSSKLEVDGGDIEVDDSASGLILRSPDGTRYRVTVANGGTLNVSAV